jgi:hypothetical protein
MGEVAWSNKTPVLERARAPFWGPRPIDVRGPRGRRGERRSDRPRPGSSCAVGATVLLPDQSIDDEQSSRLRGLIVTAVPRRRRQREPLTGGDRKRVASILEVVGNCASNDVTDMRYAAPIASTASRGVLDKGPPGVLNFSLSVRDAGVVRDEGRRG